MSSSVYKDQYKRLHPGHQAVLVCRVLAGRAYCSKRDLTRDQLDTYVVYSNRSVIPEYYIRY